MGENGILPLEVIAKLGAANRLMAWTGLGALYGKAQIVKAARRVVREVLKPRDYQEFRARRAVDKSGHGDREARAEQDSELGLGQGPLARRHDPLLLGAVQDQEEEFGGGLVTGDVTSGPNRSAPLGIERLNRIRRRDAVDHWLRCALLGHCRRDQGGDRSERHHCARGDMHAEPLRRSR